MDQNQNNSVPLKSCVNAAAIDLGEDLTKVEATFSHWAVRGLKELTLDILRPQTYREILPVHSNLKTVNIPVGCKQIIFVGVIDECGYKQALTKKSQIAGPFNEIDCIDKCAQCNQAIDICEQLQVEETTSDVDILGNTYTNTTTKYLEGNEYYIVKKTWVLNTVNETVEQKITKEFLTAFDMLSCGCLAPTDENIYKVKENCFECYSACYCPCTESSDDLGGYNIFYEAGFIQLDKHVPYSKIYIVYEGNLPKVNGVFHIPEICFEALVNFIKLKYTAHKRHYSIPERDRIERKYLDSRRKLRIILGRKPLSDILNSLRKTPRFDIPSPGGAGGGVCTMPPLTSNPTISNTPTTPTTPTPTTDRIVIVHAVVDTLILQVTGTSSPVTGITPDSLIISCAAFAGKRVQVFRGGSLLPQIDLQNGEDFCTKDIASTDIILHSKLVSGEYIEIETIN